MGLVGGLVLGGAQDADEQVEVGLHVHYQLFMAGPSTGPA